MVSVCLDDQGGSLVYVSRNPEGIPTLRECHAFPAADPETCKQQLTQLVKEYQLQGTDAVMVLSAGNYQLMQVDMAGIPDGERRDAARWQIRDLLDCAVDQAVVDLYDVPPFIGDKKSLTYVVAAQQGQLRDKIGMLGVAELRPRAIDIPEFALRNLTDLFAEDCRGGAILLLQEDDGLLVIARDGTLYLARRFPIGMSALRPYAEGDYEALTEQVDAIVLEIQRSFDYCESSFHLPVVSRLLVAQTGQEIPAIVNYLDEFLATQVESLCLQEMLPVPEGIEPLELNRHLLAIGCALRQEEAT